MAGAAAQQRSISVKCQPDGHEKWLSFKKREKKRGKKKKKRSAPVLYIPCQELQSSRMLSGDFHDQRVLLSLFLLLSQSHAL